VVLKLVPAVSMVDVLSGGHVSVQPSPVRVDSRLEPLTSVQACSQRAFLHTYHTYGS